VVTVKPAAGDVWPGGSADVAVTFAPSRPELFTRLLFCDVAGRESRLSLRVQGQGLGPALALQRDSFDLGQHFRGSVTRFQVR
jgi:hydrocephalus-inducing protein